MSAKALVGIFAVAVFGIGCTLSSPDETPTASGKTAEGQQGLTIFKASPQEGLVGMFREGKRVVLFETSRTIVTHDDWDMFDSSGVPVSITTRFTDADGEALYTSFGEAPPPAWGGSDKLSEKRFDKEPTVEWLEERVALLEVAKHAGEALAKAKLPDARMEPERKDIVTIAAVIAEGSNKEKDDHPEASVAKPVVDGSTTTTTTADVPQDTIISGASYYREKFRIKTNFLHVCTLWKNYYWKSGYWYYWSTIDNKDHGSANCANDGDSVKCTVYTGTRGSTSSMRTTMKFCDASETCNNSSGDTNECKGTGTYYSEYCVVRLNILAGGECHNCKRDTWVQKNWVLDRYDSRGGGNCWWDAANDPGCNGLTNVAW